MFSINCALIFYNGKILRTFQNKINPELILNFSSLLYLFETGRFILKTVNRSLS